MHEALPVEKIDKFAVLFMCMIVEWPFFLISLRPYSEKCMFAFGLVQVGVTPLQVTPDMGIFYLNIDGPASLLTSEVTLAHHTKVGISLIRLDASGVDGFRP